MKPKYPYNRGGAFRSKVAWLIVSQLRKAWFRVVSFAVLALATVVLARPVADIVPQDWIGTVASGAIDQALTIMASSMLAVTTFSLSVAVSAFSAMSQSATPRAAALLQEDPTTQSVLSTFLGAFLFSLVGVVALNAGFYSEAGEFVLFIATVGVIALVIIAFLRWTAHLMRFGRMEDTLDRVEAAALEAVVLRSQSPCLGASEWDGRRPAMANPVCGNAIGYVQHVDVPELSAIAERFNIHIWIKASPGTFVHDRCTLAYVTGNAPDENVENAIRSAITCARTRTFDQDPEYAVRVLSEIAIKALSPAVNDPGTATDVIGRLTRILSFWRSETTEETETKQIFMQSVSSYSLLAGTVLPIARSAGPNVEIYTQIHVALEALSCIAPETFGDGIEKISTAIEKIAVTAGLDGTEKKSS